MTLIECIDKFMRYVESYSSAATVEYYTINLRMFSEYIDELKGTCEININEVTKDVYINYITYQKNRNIKRVSVRTYARAIKVFLRYCYNEGYMLENITLNVKFPKPDKKLVVPLSSAGVELLHEYLSSKTYNPNRNLLIFYLMLDCGMRLSEVINLNIEDVYIAEKYICINDSKNGKSRVVPMSDNVYKYVLFCLKHRDIVLDQALIVNKFGKRMNKNSIHDIFRKMKKVYNVHPHLLRHTFATSYIAGGGSLEKLRVLMGHEDYNVTRQYLHIASQVQVINLDIYKLDDVYFNVYNYRK